MIFLGTAGRLEFLRLVAPRILVPLSVLREIRAHGPEDPASVAVDAATWLETRTPPPPPPSVLGWDLGAGESAVIAVALQHPGAVAILDDLQARRCAESLGIPVAGTLGIVLLARRAGLLTATRPFLEELRQKGMWLSDRVLNLVLQEFGE